MCRGFIRPRGAGEKHLQLRRIEIKMMNWISRNNILIVGLGLMGGSYAKALKRLGFKVEAIDSRPESIRFAEENGLIDRGYPVRGGERPDRPGL